MKGGILMKKKMEFESIITEFEQVSDFSAQQDVNGGSIIPSRPPILKYGVRPTTTPKPTKTVKPTTPIVVKYGVFPTVTPVIK